MFNNFFGGVFMSLADAYGLELVSVEVWGFIWGALSLVFIVGGIGVSKFGLTKKPLRLMFVATIITWFSGMLFAIQASIILFIIGMIVYMLLIPAIEAAEQTVLQRVVPKEKQGRVFGFAQTAESLATPIMTLAIGPITQLFFIPFMTTGKGVDLIGDWFGVGVNRGIGLVFILASFFGLVVTVLAMQSQSYRHLAKEYEKK
jgi:DHA3 family multidrug efflux protein-like MFS transporter